ncbi:His Kinase A domain containing protein [Linnemannia gamsii]|uniref:histidine kinase n=1 Tax=Linnemannia gamsii TaxID=64522 RepID=A0ABQ7JXN6_9FUNG|nr:His Kinase A domain containing protein [Linnemannia gamsii]
MTSPMPILSAYAAQSGNNSQLSWNPITSGKGSDAQAFEDASPADSSQSHSEPSSQLLPANQLPAASRSSLTPCEIPLQSGSLTSALSALTPAASGPGHCNSTSPIVPSNHKTSITDSLKRHWSKGQALHRFLDAQQGEGVTPNPSRSSPRDRRQPETLGLSKPLSPLNQMPDARSGNLKLDAISLLSHAGDVDTSQAGQDPTTSRSRSSDTKSRRISTWAPSGSSTSTTSSTPSSSTPVQSKIGLAERLTNLAKPKRYKSSSWTDKRISSKGYQKAQNHASKQQQSSTQQGATVEPDYESWDDFLEAYSQGHFPNDAQIRPKHLGPDLPPFPPYARALTQSRPPPFLAPPLPPNEERRLRALYSFQILETGTDLNFDRIAQLVGTVLGVSGCMICLVDQDNVAIKANYCAANMECPRGVSLSGHAILRAPDDPLVILDATKDWRFNGLPAVRGGPLVRFYAGAALSTPDGDNIGSLCVIDPEPRATFTEKERLLLVDFAAVVMREMTLWNDQVNLCTRTRMMRDITCWVSDCLDMTKGESTPTLAPSPEPDFVRGRSFDPSKSRRTPSLDGSRTLGSTSIITGSPDRHSKVFYPQSDTTILPTPGGSPTFRSRDLKGCDKATQLQSINESSREDSSTSDRLYEKAFSSACNMIQATLGADAVYLVQTGPNKSFLPQAGSGVSWNLWSSKNVTKGSVGTVGSAEDLMDYSDLALECLASSTRQLIDEPLRDAQRQGKSWVCSEKGCRPHRIRDFQQDIIEPIWERDLPVISETMRYVRRLRSAPTRLPGQGPLYTCCPDSEENNWFESARSSSRPSGRVDDSARSGLLCHTFQGTLPELDAGPSSPYKSCVIMPIRGASSTDYTHVRNEEPWAYFVVLTASPSKQFLSHERIYLKNFGSCLVTEVMKRRIEAADKAKGIFIKNISHELRTPLHIILGILELLQANTEETLTEQQLTMLGSAEASGKGLIETINNIIDLADLDPNNQTDVEHGRKQLSDLFANVSEIDIRELCEEVAESMAKRCIDKNMVISPSRPSTPLASLSVSTISTPTPGPHLAATSVSAALGAAAMARVLSTDDSVRDLLLADSRVGVTGRNQWSDGQTCSLELLVAMDEPENTHKEDIHWNFMLNLPVVKRILTQLFENAIKFTTTGFVEISAVSPPLSKFPLKPPHPSALPVLFTVRDTGRGISPEYVQSHLFERFSQEDPLQAGTGLGLALVKLLVESLGGWLEVWSEGIEGKGCVIRVLIWATPSTTERKSLRDEEGPWQGKSCRFFAGDSSVSSDRLWKIVGERMMGEDLGMAVERGQEQDICAEDMLKGLGDGSPCDMLVFNNDLGRLEAYLAHWRDQRQRVPTPLLMLTTVREEKKARAMVDAYLRTWKESVNPLHNPVRVAIMSKPTGPLKLMNSLHECFSDCSYSNSNSNSNRRGSEFDQGFQASEGTATLCEQVQTNIGPFKLIRSITSPHITTLSMIGGDSGGNGQDNSNNNTLLFSAESVIKSSFKFPTTSLTPGSIVGGHVGIGVGYFGMAYSPGGLVLPPRKEDNDDNDDNDGNENCLASASKIDAQKLELEVGSFLGDHHRPPMPSKGMARHIGGELLGEVLPTPPQPTPPQPHPNQQVQQQVHGHRHQQGEGKEQEQEPLPAVKQKGTRRSIRNFKGSHMNRTSRGGNRKSISPASTVIDLDSPSLPLSLSTSSRIQPLVHKPVSDSATASATTPANTHGDSDEASFPWSDLRVLIVEDNVTNRMILRTFFRKKGVTVVEAENGQVGVKLFEEELGRQGGKAAFDYVLMDLQMPVMDGNMATKRIREAEARTMKEVISGGGGEYCPSTIFALTGLAGEEDKQLAFECGVDGYLTKPVSLNNLATLLASCRPVLSASPSLL